MKFLAIALNAAALTGRLVASDAMAARNDGLTWNGKSSDGLTWNGRSVDGFVSNAL